MNDFWWEVLVRLPITVPIALVSGVLSGIGSFLISKYLEKRYLERLRHRLMRAKEVYAQKHGRFEVALVLSAREDIKQAAVDHLADQDRGDMQIFQVHQAEPFGDKEELWTAYLEQVKERIREIRQLGATRIYLFTNLPLAMAIFAGATLTNGPETLIHHYASGHYEPIGRLTAETIRF